MVSLDVYARAVERTRLVRAYGTVKQALGLVVEIAGIRAAIGDVVEIDDVLAPRDAKPLDLEVTGFRGDHLLTTPLGSTTGVRPGQRVRLTTRGAEIPVGDELIGRVIDAFGTPLDGLPPRVPRARAPVHAKPPPAVSRRPISEPFTTGVKVLDALCTMGRGQRLGIFSGAGVGKTTLLGMLARGSSADVNVIALVGERGREVNEFLLDTLGPDGLARSVIVCATSDEPPLVRARAADTATAIAEHFRDQGKSVLLVMDSVTRYAMALREVALATGELPATKGYPPSVFAALPRLLERAGTDAGPGAITAVYTVLVEGDDLSDPIPDAVRSILDGHVVLARDLADRGHFPAVDPLASLSRLSVALAPAEVTRAAQRLRELLGAYRGAKDLIQVGAYVRGSDARVDRAVEMMPRIEAFLRQDMRESVRREDASLVLTGLFEENP